MTELPDPARAGEKLVTWEDARRLTAALPTLSGRDFLQRIVDGELPAPPIARLIGFDLVAVGDGEVTFAGTPDESVRNLNGGVHGGYVCTLLDAAVGYAAHTLLPAGTTCTSIELKVNYLRPVRVTGGALTVTGRVTKAGRRVTFAEGEMADGDGTVLATGQGTVLIIEAV